MFRSQQFLTQSKQAPQSQQIQHSSCYGITIQSPKFSTVNQRQSIQARAQMIDLKMKISKKQEMIDFYKQQLKRREERQKKEIEDRKIKKEEEMTKMRQFVNEQKEKNMIYLIEGGNRSEANTQDLMGRQRDKNFEDDSLWKYLDKE